MSPNPLRVRIAVLEGALRTLKRVVPIAIDPATTVAYDLAIEEIEAAFAVLDEGDDGEPEAARESFAHEPLDLDSSEE